MQLGPGCITHSSATVSHITPVQSVHREYSGIAVAQIILFLYDSTHDHELHQTTLGLVAGLPASSILKEFLNSGVTTIEPLQCKLSQPAEVSAGV